MDDYCECPGVGANCVCQDASECDGDCGTCDKPLSLSNNSAKLVVDFSKVKVAATGESKTLDNLGTFEVIFRYKLENDGTLTLENNKQYRGEKGATSSVELATTKTDLSYVVNTSTISIEQEGEVEEIKQEDCDCRAKTSKKHVHYRFKVECGVTVDYTITTTKGVDFTFPSGTTIGISASSGKTKSETYMKISELDIILQAP
jgi:hypothetical protein